MSAFERWSLPEQVVIDLGRLLFGALLRLRVEGREHLPDSGGALIVCNHPTMLEPVLLTLALPRPVTHLALPTPWKYPATGYFMDLFRCLRMTEGRPNLSVFRAALTRLREGCLVAVFPEGGLSDDGRLGEFDAGAAELALRAGCPVVPAAVRGGFESMRRGRTIPRVSPVSVCFGPPVDCRPALSRRRGPQVSRAVAEEMRRAVAGLLRETPR